MNKTLLTISQVFVAIAAAVIGIYALIFMFVLGQIESDVTFNIVGLVMFIIVGFNIFVFIRIGQAKDNPYMKTEIIIYSIILLLTSNILGGVFALLGVLLEDNGQTQSESSSLEKRLKDLDNLFDKGLITLDEYHERRKKIIESV
ncbi:SHOCT domain-containing protein [Acholeplasma laidlawii]|uniref:Integral membrane protein n=2 Tax=Acholeplasma laidlawii TaxID=2148 RepID=A9NHA8_ACHLI|nr:SHOCT domain-containing protein [Acholeplasma laidlawii]ABX81738.1 integral membrane protein [Acholeplasma laidlawii PG-8A]NWH11076.1 SHOCT domain-containing protein [Acholeplasma laidlawii]NWH12462.1 SHOCT domain-containing protein [Acholeplasma laidlawii]NWH13848.1 SHOCT domain-containing protein [Acholeplasma laidlawii]NWH15206.1 SHOCT domain-containing protein [Acholeplasma laidlawii]